MQPFMTRIFLVLLTCFLAACSSPDSPKGIAKSFWDGVVAQDEAKVREYSTSQSHDMVNFSQNTVDWKLVTVKLGATDIVNDTAMVHTEVLDKGNGHTYMFNTYLVQENGAWRVDYLRTQRASVTSEIFTNLVDNLQKLNLSLTQHYEDTVAGLVEAAPAIKQQLDMLSENLMHKEHVAAAHPTTHQKLEALKLTFKDMFTHKPGTETTPVPAPAPSAPETKEATPTKP